jgi:nucleosome binding factor SPN SPT16 subunit
MGSAIGIEFRDSTTLLNAKNTRVLKAGMALNVSIGFQNLDNPEGKNSKESKYSLLLVDTVLVTNDAPVVLTDSQKELKHISFFIKDEESEEEKPAPKRSEKRGEAKSTSVFTRDRTRGQGKDVDDSDEVRRREHQKELHVQKQEEGLARFKDQGDGDANGTNGPQIKKFESYKRPNQLPSSVDELKVVVDSRNQTVIVPIYGVPVPFHISTLRNASKNDEGDYVYLRLNFMTPGQGIAKADTLVRSSSIILLIPAF